MLKHEKLKAQNPPRPAHVAIIMDGNGRWARARHLPRSIGHKKGADALKRTLEACESEGIRCLTIYAFSAENWKRPSDEISELMQLLKTYLTHEVASLHKKNIRLRFIGQRENLAADVVQMMAEAERLTAKNESFTLNVALSYGSQQELTHAMRQIAAKVASGALKPHEVNAQHVEQELETHGLPPLDLLIRTGGEQRLSNFLLWQSAYTELYFTPVLWPDFNHEHLREALAAYATRERRYGTA